MRKIIIKLIILIVYTNTVVSCVYDPPPERIDIYNNSNSTIYAYYSCNNLLPVSSKLKLFDTIFSQVENKVNIIAPEYRFSPYSFGKGGLYSKSWKNYINSCEDKTLKIFFIDEQVMKVKNWESIIEEQSYLKKIEISLKDLKAQNWIIEYNE